MTGIGIDTGGTYTDAVIYDSETREIIASAKSLTTREDLKKGITKVLKKLPGEKLKEAKMLALSTTLATNICVENKGGRAKLIFIGVSRDTFLEVGKDYGIDRTEDVFFLDCEISSSEQNSTQPDWEAFEKEIPSLVEGCAGISVVQLFSRKYGGSYEKKARLLIQKYFSGPVILGKDLFLDLNAIKRGAGALLNARLVPVIQEFLEAVKKVFQEYGIAIPPVIVRSDGTLMNEAMACEKPVETLLCGPAASIVGAMHLSGEKDAFIVDMGGTTTDVAVVENGRARKVTDGIHIGNWSTFVKGLFVDTFGLGGDTAVHYDAAGRLYLENYRMVPLSNLAGRYPYVADRLQTLLDSGKKDSFPLHEFLLLVKEPREDNGYTRQEQKLCQALKNGPLILEDAAAAVGKDFFNLQTGRLEQEGLIIRSGLTPTDAMVLKGDYLMGDRRAAAYAAGYLERMTDVSADEFADRVYDLVMKRLYCNLVRILLQTGNTAFSGEKLDRQIEQLIAYSYEQKKKPESNPMGMLLADFSTSAVLVGAGAPTHVFLEPVARLLGTRAVIVPHAEVANAIGAVVGNVSVTLECELVPVYTTAGIERYDVFCGDEKKSFREYEEACSYLRQRGTLLAREEAVRRGAKGGLSVETELVRQKTVEQESDLFLSEKYYVSAMGKAIIC